MVSNVLTLERKKIELINRIAPVVPVDSRGRVRRTMKHSKRVTNITVEVVER